MRHGRMPQHRPVRHPARQEYSNIRLANQGLALPVDEQEQPSDEPKMAEMGGSTRRGVSSLRR
jgi:hypothetical protein